MMEGLSEDERKALRGSKFAPLPPPSFRSQQPRYSFLSLSLSLSLSLLFRSISRVLFIDYVSYTVRLAHPGGPLRTNKAAALAKFLERKLQDPNGLASIDPDILELAVKNAKDTVLTSNNYFKPPLFFLFF
jgi:hypothetical protein